MRGVPLNYGVPDTLSESTNVKLPSDMAAI